MKINQNLLDLGPLLLFLAVYFLTGKNMMLAIPVIMVATAIALVISYLQSKKISVMPVITLVTVLLFGGLALYFDNPVFFMIKPTIIYLLFASALGVGVFFGQYFLKILFEGSFDMPNNIWAKLTWRWAGFFIFLAGLNEFVWRTFGESTWAIVKVAGFLPLTLVFAMINMPLMMKYMAKDDEKPVE
jgi:intracellular septation protein